MKHTTKVKLAFCFSIYSLIKIDQRYFNFVSQISFFQLPNASQLPDRIDQGGVRLHHVGGRWERLPQEVHGGTQEHQAERKGA